MKTDKNWYLIEIINTDGTIKRIKKRGTVDEIKYYVSNLPKLCGQAIDVYPLGARSNHLSRGSANQQEVEFVESAIAKGKTFKEIIAA